MLIDCFFFCFFKQKTAYDMRISDWSSDVCSSDLMLSFKSKSLSRQKSSPAQHLRKDDDDENVNEERVNIRFIQDENGNTTSRIAAASVNKLIEHMRTEERRVGK